MGEGRWIHNYVDLVRRSRYYRKDDVEIYNNSFFVWIILVGFVYVSDSDV